MRTTFPPPQPIARPGAPDPPRSVIIVPFGTGIGDLALQRGLFAAVARHWPHADVRVFAPARVAPLLPPGVRPQSRVLGIPAWDRVPFASPALSALGPLEWRAIDLAMGHLPLARLGALPGMALIQRYDRAINLLGAFTATVDPAREWLPPPDGHPTGPHLLDRLTAYLTAAGIPLTPDDLHSPLPISGDDTGQAGRTLATLVPGASPAVLVIPHAGSPLKTPPVAWWHQVITRLRSAGIAPLVSAGTTWQERDQATRIAGQNGAVLTRLSLGAMVALSRQVGLTLAPDTGLLHLIALDRGRWLGLFGATNPYLAGPYQRDRGRFLIARPPRAPACHTCWQRFTLGSTCCPPIAAGTCVATLAPTTVAATVLDMLTR